MNFFSPGDYVVYPPHGVGKFIGSESHEIGGEPVELFIICFEKEKMTLKLPGKKVKTAGLRHLSSSSDMDEALKKLSVKIRIKKSMWSRRAVEYETKINSGNPVFIAEVIRELFCSNPSVDQSYSERQIYQSAFERLSRELAAVKSIDETDAAKELKEILKAA